MSTKSLYLESWQRAYNSFEINQPRERNPVQPVYSRLIDSVKRSQTFDCEEEATTLIAAALGKGKECWDGKSAEALAEMQDRARTSVLLDLDNIDEWMNEHLATTIPQ